MEKLIRVCVEENEKSERVDSYLAKKLSGEFTRTMIKKWIQEGRVLVNTQSVKPHFHISPGDTIQVKPVPPPVDFSKAEDIPIQIIYEDDDLLIINKSAGMVVHPGVGNKEGTLVNALLFHVKKLSTISGPMRPGIVHRLDKNTSGLMVVAKNDWTHERLAKQFKSRTATRIYNCFVKGIVQHDEGCFDEPIGRSATDARKMRVDPASGKPAVTTFFVRKRFVKSTCLDVKLYTGRTHQIRVHMAYHGHPVLGDKEYGVKSTYIKRQALHAGSLELVHPRTGKGLSFHAPLPDDMQFLLDRLNEPVDS
ncbi:MAG: RluA family pseudouridine synthase [Candidatus Omnitrophica bacterium]|nr:RluA family pseudouridine synthase [Candidatus Omnitrophota bacterium]